ncbi:MAG: SCO family protein, partial [Bacteroidota bacterium]
MKSFNIKYISLIFLAFTLSCNESKNNKATSRVDNLPYYNEASFTPSWLSFEDEKLKDFHKIPSFNLTNQDGQVITDKTFEDKIYIVDFFFTSCPGICPKMTSNMSIIQDEFINDDDVL